MRRHLLVWLSAISALGVVGLVLANQPPEMQVSYVTADAIMGRLSDTVTAAGTLNAVVTVEVGSQLSGRIMELFVDFNDSVTKGQAVARLDPQSYEARLAEAVAALKIAEAGIIVKEAELARARAQLAEAEANLAVLDARVQGVEARLAAMKADLARRTALRSRNLVSIEELEIAQMQSLTAAAALKEAQAVLAAHRISLTSAEAEVARQVADLTSAHAIIPQKQALRDLAEVDLQRTVIRTPIDGTVISRNVSEGQTVAASLEAPTLFTIVQDLAQMELHARIDETDIGQIRIGQPAQFRVDAFPDETFEGRVDQIRKSPENLQGVVTYTVVIRTQNRDLLLLPGMTATIEILTMESEPVLKVPIAALTFQPEGSGPVVEPGEAAIWILTPDGPKPVYVQTGQSDSSDVAVQGDLAEGEKVITHAISAPPQRSLFGIRLGF